MKNPNHTRYVIILNKVSDGPTNSEFVRRHIEFIRKLDKDAKLELCGPFTDYPSGMVIVKAKDKAEAISIAESDPFVKEGVRKFEVRTWQLACSENNYLG